MIIVYHIITYIIIIYYIIYINDNIITLLYTILNCTCDQFLSEIKDNFSVNLHFYTKQSINKIIIFDYIFPAHKNETPTNIDVWIFVTLFPSPMKYKEYRKQLSKISWNRSKLIIDYNISKTL
jgi:hypothetical protein